MVDGCGNGYCSPGAKWKDYPLMQNLLLAIYDYMDFKAKEKTKELNEFV